MNNTNKNFRNPDYVRLNVFIHKHLMKRLDNVVIVTERDKSDLVREAISIYVGGFEREHKDNL